MPITAPEAVHVAVGVLVDDDDRVLICRRPDDAHQGGLWEFPGGKVETGESVHQALVRELHEELGVTVGTATPLLEIEHDYGDKRVVLQVMLVRDWRGEPWGAEGQPMAWIHRTDLGDYAFPDANQSIVTRLSGPLE